MESIADRMKEVMELYHLNTSETAKMIGMSESELSGILNDNLGIRTDYFDRFCDTFKISENWLEWGVGDMRTGIRTYTHTTKEVELELAKLMRTTYENNQMLKEILEYIRKVDDDEHMNKEQVREFVSNVVANLLTDMLLQPKGRGHIDKEFINDVINRMK